MIEKPIIKRKNAILRYTKNEAFDMPTLIPSVAMDYFSGTITLETATQKLIHANHLIGCESKEEVFVLLKKSLTGNERFFEPIEEPILDSEDTHTSEEICNSEKNFKLRIYKLTGTDAGNLDHEEFFETKDEMDRRYNELFIRELYALNPTAWEKSDSNWKRLEHY